MSRPAKRTTQNDVIDSRGSLLLQAALPSHWKLRPYRPDFGLDFAVEIFRATPGGEGASRSYETLGEHFFIQLKSSEEHGHGSLTLREQGNVEKTHLASVGEATVGTIETLRHSLEMAELVTVERMGAGIPVLLVLADLSKKQCYFVCLNDYIDKVLAPAHEDYTSSDSRTIHVPTLNAIDGTGVNHLRWYGKRAKLYAAFQKFTYQYAELAQTTGGKQWGLSRALLKFGDGSGDDYAT